MGDCWRAQAAAEEVTEAEAEASLRDEALRDEVLRDEAVADAADEANRTKTA